MKLMAMVAGVILTCATAAVADSREEKVARYVKDMDSDNAKTRAMACTEVGKIAAVKVSYGKPAVDPMIKLLKDKEANVRAAAAEALGKVDEPKKTVPALTALFKDEKAEAVKIAAAIGLGLIGDAAKEAVPMLRETAQQARQDKNMRLAQACQQAIQNIAGRGKNK